VKGVHPLINQQFSYVRLAAPMLDSAVISTEFSEVIVLTLFHLFARGITDKPHKYTLGSAMHFYLILSFSSS